MLLLASVTLRIVSAKRITLEKGGRRAIETSGNKILTKEDVDIFRTPILLLLVVVVVVVLLFLQCDQCTV